MANNPIEQKINITGNFEQKFQEYIQYMKKSGQITDQQATKMEKDFKGVSQSISKVEQSSKGLKGAFDKLSSFSQKAFFPIQMAQQFAAALGSVVNEVKELTQAYAVQYQAEMQLQTALRNHGEVTDEVFNQYKQFVSELQGKSVFGDEGTLQILTRLTQADMDYAQATNLVTAAANFAAISGDNLSSAVDKLHGITTRGARTMEKYASEEAKAQLAALDLNDSLTAQEKYAQELNIIVGDFNKNLAGMAEIQREADGGITALSNTWGDFQEMLGKNLLPIVQKITEALDTFLNDVINSEGTGELDGFKQAFDSVVATMGNLWEVLQDIYSAFKSVWDVIGGSEILLDALWTIEKITEGMAVWSGWLSDIYGQLGEIGDEFSIWEDIIKAGLLPAMKQLQDAEKQMNLMAETFKVNQDETVKSMGLSLEVQKDLATEGYNAAKSEEDKLNIIKNVIQQRIAELELQRKTLVAQNKAAMITKRAEELIRDAGAFAFVGKTRGDYLVEALNEVAPAYVRQLNEIETETTNLNNRLKTLTTPTGPTTVRTPTTTTDVGGGDDDERQKKTFADYQEIVKALNEQELAARKITEQERLRLDHAQREKELKEQLSVLLTDEIIEEDDRDARLLQQQNIFAAERNNLTAEHTRQYQDILMNYNREIDALGVVNQRSQLQLDQTNRGVDLKKQLDELEQRGIINARERAVIERKLQEIQEAQLKALDEQVNKNYETLLDDLSDQLTMLQEADEIEQKRLTLIENQSNYEDDINEQVEQGLLLQGQANELLEKRQTIQDILIANLNREIKIRNAALAKEKLQAQETREAIESELAYQEQLLAARLANNDAEVERLELEHEIKELTHELTRELKEQGFDAQKREEIIERRIDLLRQENELEKKNNIERERNQIDDSGMEYYERRTRELRRSNTEDEIDLQELELKDQYWENIRKNSEAVASGEITFAQEAELDAADLEAYINGIEELTEEVTVNWKGLLDLFNLFDFSGISNMFGKALAEGSLEMETVGDTVGSFVSDGLTAGLTAGLGPAGAMIGNIVGPALESSVSDVFMRIFDFDTYMEKKALEDARQNAGHIADATANMKDEWSAISQYYDDIYDTTKNTFSLEKQMEILQEKKNALADAYNLKNTLTDDYDLSIQEDYNDLIEKRLEYELKNVELQRSLNSTVNELSELEQYRTQSKIDGNQKEIDGINEYLDLLDQEKELQNDILDIQLNRLKAQEDQLDSQVRIITGLLDESKNLIQTKLADGLSLEEIQPYIDDYVSSLNNGLSQGLFSQEEYASEISWIYDLATGVNDQAARNASEIAAQQAEMARMQVVKNFLEQTYGETAPFLWANYMDDPLGIMDMDLGESPETIALKEYLASLEGIDVSEITPEKAKELWSKYTGVGFDNLLVAAQDNLKDLGDARKEILGESAVADDILAQIEATRDSALEGIISQIDRNEELKQQEIDLAETTEDRVSLYEELLAMQEEEGQYLQQLYDYYVEAGATQETLDDIQARINQNLLDQQSIEESITDEIEAQNDASNEQDAILTKLIQQREKLKLAGDTTGIEDSNAAIYTRLVELGTSPEDIQKILANLPGYAAGGITSELSLAHPNEAVFNPSATSAMVDIFGLGNLKAMTQSAGAVYNNTSSASSSTVVNMGGITVNGSNNATVTADAIWKVVESKFRQQGVKIA